MLKYIKIAIVLFACSGIAPLKAQNNPDELPVENISIQASQQVLFSGEIVWFSLISTNSLHENALSNRAFVELINSSNTTILRKKVHLSEGVGHSYFQLPDTLSSGVYRMLAYTSWMKNFETLPYSELAIINPEMPFKSTINEKILGRDSEPPPHIKSYGKRKRIELVEFIDLNEMVDGCYSVSVKRKEPKLFVPTERENTTSGVANNGERYYPDYQGIVVSGTLFRENNEPAENTKVILSTPGNGVDLQSAVTNENGRFRFLLQNKLAEQDLIFTLPDSEMQMKLDDPFLNPYDFANTPNLQIDTLAETFLQEKYFYRQLAQKFDNPTSEPAPTDSINGASFTFYSSPDRLFKMSDYVLLDSLTEYFHELIPSVQYRLAKNNYHFKIINQENNLPLQDNPGIFVDGVLYSNLENLAKIPTQQLDRIEVIWNKYYYKDFTFGGIVSIFTKNADFYSIELQENMTRIIYPLSDANNIQFKSKTYTENEIPSNRPDLRFLLYWNPEVEKEKLSELYFYTSDVSGTYEIAISGYTENGNFSSFRKEFEVK